ncbi:MAG: MmgE/PrpD family protein [Proteobacteria bacterium]|nr:MmgE/PrpD family protein [Pseudomonadota bacterium]
MNAPIANGSLTAALDRHVRTKPVSAGDLQGTALFTLDAIAGIVGGRFAGAGPLLAAWAGTSTDTGRRAFLLGAYSNILEMDAMHRESAVHAGTVVVPAALAVGERIGCDGAALLTAILKGCEVAFRIGAAVGPSHYKIYQNTATCGPFGAAMAASLLLGLDPARTVDALGNAGTTTGGLWEFLASGAMSKQVHAGRAAESGVVAAELAGHGMTGPPTILEGARGFFRAACPDGDPAAVMRDPDRGWALHRSSTKPWPSPRHTHPAIDAALALADEVRGRPIDTVRVDTYRVAVDLCGHADPRDAHEARFSVQHCVAAALTDGVVGFDSFDDAARTRLGPLTRRVEVRAAEPFLSAYPKAWGARVEAVFTDGATVAASRDHARGDPEAPMSAADITAKARDLLRRAGVADPAALIASVLAMADGGPLVCLPSGV